MDSVPALMPEHRTSTPEADLGGSQSPSARARLDTLLEGAIAVLLGSTVLFSALATGAIRPQDFLIVQALALAAGCLWLVRIWLSPEPRLHFPPVAWAVLAFAACVTLRYFTADLEYVARKEFLRFLVYALVFFLALHHLGRPRWADWMVSTAVVLGSGITLYAVQQHLAHSNKVWHFLRPLQYANRGSGTFICPNHMAGFLEVVLLLGLGYLFLGVMKRRTRVTLGYAAVWLLAGIYVSMSRGGWAATVLGLAAFFLALLALRRHQGWAVVLPVALLLAGLAFELRTSQIRQRFQTMFEDNPTNDLAGRMMIWRTAYHMWQDHPWSGVGPGHFDYRFRPYRPVRFQVRPDRAHNDYLNVLVDFGLAGFIPMTLAAGCFGVAVLKRRGSVASPESAAPDNTLALRVGGATGLLALAVHSLVDYHLYVPANALLAATLLAMILSRTQPDRWTSTSRPARLVASLLVIPLVLFLLFQLWQGGRESRWLETAAAARQVKDIRTEIRARERAFEIDPANFETAYTLGELYRLWSWQGGEDYRVLAERAMGWFERSIRLNPFDPYSRMRYGMCLDWLGRGDEAGPYFLQAVKLDPLSHYTLAHMGWHLFQTGDYSKAKEWFVRSYRLLPGNNPIAVSYLNILDNKLAEEAEGR